MSYKLLSRLLPVDIVNKVLDYTIDNDTTIYHIHKILSVCTIYFSNLFPTVITKDNIKKWTYAKTFTTCFRHIKLSNIQSINKTVPKFIIDNEIYNYIIEYSIESDRCKHYGHTRSCLHCDCNKHNDEVIKKLKLSIIYLNINGSIIERT